MEMLSKCSIGPLVEAAARISLSGSVLLSFFCPMSSTAGPAGIVATAQLVEDYCKHCHASAMATRLAWSVLPFGGGGWSEGRTDKRPENRRELPG